MNNPAQALALAVLLTACGGRPAVDEVAAPTGDAGPGLPASPREGDASGGTPDGAVADVTTRADAALPCGVSPGGVFSCCAGVACLGECVDGGCVCYGIVGGCADLPEAICCTTRRACSADCR